MGRKLHKKGKTPPFIKKLVQILDNQKFRDSITWLVNGNGFQIVSVSKFIQEALPSLFKHNNFASFVRQLNMHGFSRPKESDQYVYCHPRFQRGNINSIRFIQRKNRGTHPKNSGCKSEEKDSFDESESSQSRESKNQINFPQMLNTLIAENQELKKRNTELISQLEELNKELNFDVKSSNLQKRDLSSSNTTILSELPIIISSNADNEGKIRKQTKSPSVQSLDYNNFPFSFGCFPWMMNFPKQLQASYREIS